MDAGVDDMAHHCITPNNAAIVPELRSNDRRLMGANLHRSGRAALPGLSYRGQSGRLMGDDVARFEDEVISLCGK